MRASAAFSLVELSIVLVILGLLTGGILAGQSLIRAAELRSFTTETGRYSTAINGFRDKYFALPGDMTNATAFWGKDNTNCSWNTGTTATPGTCNGDGDGRIVWNYTTGEDLRAWQQLAMAGLIEGSFSGFGESEPGITLPLSKGGNNSAYALYTADWVGNGPTYNNPGARVRLQWGRVRVLGGGINFLTNGVVSAPEAWSLDTKMDDGMPRIGKVTAGTATDGVMNCDIPVSPFPYRLDSEAKNCYLSYAVY